MGKGTIERFGVKAITGALARAADLQSARDSLSQVVGAAVEVSGTVLKRVKWDGQCKLVIQPGDVPGFVVFADCQADAEKLRKAKIRKGSVVSVRGKFQSFGSAAVCLSDCRLQQPATQKKKSSDKFGLKKENGKPQKTSISGAAKTRKETGDGKPCKTLLLSEKKERASV
jgi:hypothetical protein